VPGGRQAAARRRHGANRPGDGLLASRRINSDDGWRSKQKTCLIGRCKGLQAHGREYHVAPGEFAAVVDLSL